MLYGRVMSDAQATSPLDDLTAKQLEALEYVGAGYMSKEAARILGISHKSFDRRIEVAKNKLGAATRAEAVRIVKRVRNGVEFDHTALNPIPPGKSIAPQHSNRQGDAPLKRVGSPSTREPAWWDTFLTSASDIRPAQLGVGARLGLMLVAAVLIMAVLLLGLGIVGGLEALR